MFGRFSLGTIGLVVGSVLTIIGTIAYAQGNATLNLAGFFYGIPLLLGGLALKAAELKPVPYSQPPSPDIIELRQGATPIQTQIRNDITRYRYGQESHLDTSLAALGLSPSDEERPVLSGLRESDTDGAYTLVLEFDSPLISFEQWLAKQDKLRKFFGPNIDIALTQSADNRVEVSLIAMDSNPA
ncbi:DUF2854 domain-containing protein [Candidatus Synechococcus calcipolaris G9]|uniref:DUF2854 domain-containing protein n=1 Tax=Candidatus Synechococcus calcipolaris G9 TaxID=1497997 RepID=A0ABT6EYA7_9SYNE|nr:DUF2854 domain-containing protein [Candidatus Synechococcus calcipolaris]MDG2990795.1 DUF2854 domain-containing protein [Candidatus Synechococcus calcipolaris G9]